MTKAELVVAVAKKLDVSQADAQKSLDGVIAAIEEAVVAGEVVKIPGFLTIEPKLTVARVARNPKSGEAINVPAGRKVSVTVGSTFKTKVQI